MPGGEAVRGRSCLKKREQYKRSVVKKAYSEEQDLSNMLNAERAANRESKRIIADLRERLAKYETDAEA